MPVATAKVTNIPIAARKARLVADLIRGKRVTIARDILLVTEKAAAQPIVKLLNSAVANAEHEASTRHERVDTDEMVVNRIVVNEGRTRQKWQASARGRGMRLRNRSCHIELSILGTPEQRTEA